MNKTVLTGRITADPKSALINGKKGIGFTVAVKRKFSKNTDADSIDYIACRAFGHNADFIEKHFKRGNNIQIIGELRTNKKDTSYSTWLLVEEVSYQRSDADFEAGSKERR